MNKTRLEIMVGSFVLLAVAIFFLITFFVSGVYFLQEGYTIHSKFEYVSGIPKGAPVKIAGVSVGEVQSVEIQYDRKTQKPCAVLDLWIREGTEIREGSKAYVFGAFALNETHVEIVSNGAIDGKLLKEGDFLPSEDLIPMELLMKKGLAIADGLAEITDKVNKIMGDEKIQKYMQQMIVDMSEVMAMMNKMMHEQGDDISELAANMNAALENLNGILENVDSGEGSLGKLLKSDELYQEMTDFVKEIKAHPWRLMKRDKKK